MSNLFFKISSRLFSAAVLTALTLGIIYFASTRSLPFLTEDGQEYSIIDDDASEPGVNPGESGDEISGEVSVPGETSGDETFDINAYLSAFESVTPSGFDRAVSENKYDPADQKLVLYKDISALGSLSAPGDPGGGAPVIRMGYIFAGGRIYTSNLADVTEPLSGYTFAGERDLYGHPLFIKNGAYYYLDSSAVVQPSSFDPVVDKRGFDFDVPVYLGVQDDVIERMYIKSNPEGQKFGYYGKGRVYANYCTEAFAFSGGRGCVIRTEKKEQIIEIYSDFFYEHAGNLVASGYYPPAERGLYSIGFFYFDDGFTRVRVKKADLSYEEALIDSNGNLLDLVGDYPLVSYSDGILLVGRGSNYGYMTNNLNWITKPVYTYAEPFLEGLAVVGMADGKFGVIGTNGKYVIKPVFDYVARCSGGVVAAYSAVNGWSFFVKVYS